MSRLVKIGLAASNNKSVKEFDSLFGDFLYTKYNTPAEYVEMHCNKYRDMYCKSTSGTVFEYILATLFIREGLMPLYYSVQVAFVPNVTYDLMLYRNDKVPVCLSAKTSLRERYKQSDLEAIALKYVHRKALCYLITLDKKEGYSVQKKIKTGAVIGLDEVVIATDRKMNDLITILKESEYITADQVSVLNSRHIVSKESLKKA